VPVEEVRDVFGAARVVVTPYVVGYQSGVIHLAMTMGRAVVTADIGDLGSAVIDGETGRVVPPEDRDALVEAMEQVIADPELASSFGAEGRRRVLDRSGWETVAELVEAALGRLNGAGRR
jgi:glycosyltransferase involved in cell wall biosynthesis